MVTASSLPQILCLPSSSRWMLEADVLLQDADTAVQRIERALRSGEIADEVHVSTAVGCKALTPPV